MKMKKYIRSWAAIAVAALLTTGCDDNPNYNLDGNDATGRVNLSELGVELNTDEIELSRADGVDTSDFLVTITDNNGNQVYSSTVAEADIVVLPVGENYTVKVESHEVENVAWAKPYYAGTKSFAVTKDQITEIGTVTCRFANVRVSVFYSDALRRLMADDVRVNIDCSETDSHLEYTPDETRSGYFKAVEGSTTLGATFTGTVKNQRVTFVKALNDVAAGQHRKITFDVRSGDPSIPDENGNIVLDGESEGTPLGNGLYLVADVVNETINGNVDSNEKGDGNAQRPGGNGGGDDPQPPIGDGPITITSALSFTETMEAKEGLDGRVNVKVDPDGGNSIQSLKVKIVPGNDEFKTVLMQLFGTLEFDLADMSDELKAALGSDPFNFPCNEQVKGQNDVSFNISEFIPLLNIYPAVHKFVITVSDAQGHTEVRTLTFEAKGNQ